MTFSRRAALVFLLLGSALLLGFFFRSFLLDNFIRPVALVFLLLLRTVQSVDQQVYWYLLIASAVLLGRSRLAIGSRPIWTCPSGRTRSQRCW